MWFNQDLFAGVAALEIDGEDADAQESTEGIDIDEDHQSDNISMNQDFEIVPQGPADDEMWDVDDENTDDMKQTQLQSESRISPDSSVN
jgi:hypothetical protein